MARCRIGSQFAIVAAGLLIALGAANATSLPEIPTQDHAHTVVVSEHRARDVGFHTRAVKTERTQRLLRFGLALLAAAALAVVPRRRRLRPHVSPAGRLGRAAGSLGRSPPFLRVS